MASEAAPVAFPQSSRTSHAILGKLWRFWWINLHFLLIIHLFGGSIHFLCVGELSWVIRIRYKVGWSFDILTWVHSHCYLARIRTSSTGHLYVEASHHCENPWYCENRLSRLMGKSRETSSNWCLYQEKNVQICIDMYRLVWWSLLKCTYMYICMCIYVYVYTHTLHCIASDWIVLHYITLHCIPLHYIHISMYIYICTLICAYKERERES